MWILLSILSCAFAQQGDPATCIYNNDQCWNHAAGVGCGPGEDNMLNDWLITKTTTVTGKTCQRWDTMYATYTTYDYYTGKSDNTCTYIYSDQVGAPWCFTDSSYAYEWCYYPSDNCPGPVQTTTPAPPLTTTAPPPPPTTTTAPTPPPPPTTTTAPTPPPPLTTTTAPTPPPPPPTTPATPPTTPATPPTTSTEPSTSEAQGGSSTTMDHSGHYGQETTDSSSLACIHQVKSVGLAIVVSAGTYLIN